MPTEKLRLEAEMRDNASPVVKKLRQELAALQDSTRENRGIAKLNKEIETLRKETGGVHVTPGMLELPKWLGKATTGAQDFVKTGGGAAGVIGAMGIGGLTAAASLSGLTALMKEMGDRALDMKELGRETGMTVDQVNAFAHAGSHFGVGADAMKGAINHLSGQMPEFQRSYGTLFQELSRWPDLIKKLQKDSAEDQIKDIFTFLGTEKIQSQPQLQKQILSSIFGNGDEMEKLFAQGSKGFLAELEKQKHQLGPITPEMIQQAQEFRDATIKFNESLETFETKVGPAFLKKMTVIVDKLTAFFAQDKDAIAKKQHDGGAEDERKANQGFDDPRVREALRKKSAYRGAGRLLNLTSFGGDLANTTSSRDMLGGDTIAGGTKAGVMAAFREMMATQDVERGSGGGLLTASYGGNGFGGGRRGSGGGGNQLDAGTGSFPAGSTMEQVRQYIRAKASAIGIDPNIAERVARSEGLNRSLGAGGDGGTSDGPFQLHVGGGLGDAYERKFHHSIHDKRYWRDQVNFALEQARSGGWRPWHGWHGAANAGIGIPADSTALDALKRNGALGLSASHAPAYGDHRGAQVPIPDMKLLPSEKPRRADGLRDPGQSNASRNAGGAQHHLDVHIHDKGGSVSSAAFKSGSDSGAIRYLTRWPTMRDAGI